jgi:hypothetical protein
LQGSAGFSDAHKRIATRKENSMTKKAKATKAIVHTSDFNGHACHFMMSSDDFRFPPAAHGYTLITTGRYDRAARLFIGDDGMRYRIFPDWSARAVGRWQ